MPHRLFGLPQRNRPSRPPTGELAWWLRVIALFVLTGVLIAALTNHPNMSGTGWLVGAALIALIVSLIFPRTRPMR